MDTITIKKDELKTMIQESVREVISEEIMKFRALLVPFVSQEEQSEIETEYDSPTREIAKTIEIEI
jgi:hypothetical protein